MAYKPEYPQKICGGCGWHLRVFRKTYNDKYCSKECAESERKKRGA